MPTKRADGCTRSVRNGQAGDHARSPDKQQAFLEFVLSQYVKEGVDELDLEKLPALLKLSYGGTSDAISHLGVIQQVRGGQEFQKYLSG